VAKRKTHWSDACRAIGACGKGVRYAREFRTIKAMWKACEVWDYLDWLYCVSHGFLPGKPETQRQRDQDARSLKYDTLTLDDFRRAIRCPTLEQLRSGIEEVKRRLAKEAQLAE
jgi:hypothetical protein